MEGLIQETNGGKVKVQLLNGETHEFKQELVTQVFPYRQICLGGGDNLSSSF